MSNNHNKKRYMIYDGDVLVGTYTGAEAGELFGVHKYSIGKYAYSGDLLNGRYTVKREEDVIEREKVIRKWDFREGWDAEWEAATAALREEIEVEKLIRKNWDKAGGPSGEETGCGRRNDADRKAEKDMRAISQERRRRKGSLPGMPACGRS